MKTATAFVPTPLPGARVEHQAAASPYGSTAGPPGMAAGSNPQHQAGGQITFDRRDATFQAVSRFFSRLPLGAMYLPSVSPAQPVTYEIGTFLVPPGKTLWCMDYEFGIMKLSGLQAGMMVPAADGEFFGQIAFDISINGTRRQVDIANELDPRPISLQREQYVVRTGTGPRATAQTILRARQEQYGAASGFGASALPQLSGTYSPRGQRVTIRGDEGDNLVLRFSVFRPLATPIGAIVGKFSGYLMHRQIADALETRMRAI